MRLPKNLLNPGTYAKPRIFLCETNKERMCELETSGTQGSFKFNSYSELSFEVGRFYNDIITGESLVNPFFDKIEALRLIELEDIGYFEIQGPDLTSDGIKEAKNITSYSLEYTLSQKYLEDFYVNTGEVNSVEVINASSENSIVPVTLYNPSNDKLSLLDLILEKVHGWSIKHVDPQLQTLSRQFEVDRESIYDFLMNEVCEKFNCYIEFDTLNSEISVYAESPTAKFICDGKTDTFSIGTSASTFSEVKTVSIDGYKTTRWGYGFVDGVGTLVLEDMPAAGAMVEVVGVDSTWYTDVFVTFDNLSQEVQVNYSADDIKTVLTVTFGDDNDIREVNLGLPYIVDLSYYCTPEWLGQDLYDDWLAYQEKCNSKQADYTKNSKDMLYYAGQIDYEENRLSLGYAEITVDENSVGTYYVRGGTYPNYYYTEVSLPAEYNVNTTYYSTKTTNLEDGSDGNVAHLYEALKKYFMYAEDWKTDLDALAEEFDFIDDDTIANLSSELEKVTEDRTSNSAIESTLNIFFHDIWKQLGRTPLKQLYYEPYKKVQITNMEAGWSQENHAEYGNYYTVILLLNSIEAAIADRDNTIKEHENQYALLISENASISNELLIDNNFTPGQLIRLNAFLREDELHLDDIITTAQDSVSDTYKNQQDALESGRIELGKLSRPQLQFSMSMANIYALPEFEPIIDQFQLGKIIKVGIRPDYIKQSRLMQIDMGFDDFSDFSCEFGELTNLRSQSDIHADLLKNAISAGKSVAQNASYWTKGSDKANSIDLKLQEGLLNSIEAIKAIDGTQNAYMDKYGLHLEVVNPDTGEIGDKRVWMVNNQIVFTDDGFKTTKAALGEFKVDDTTYYGLLAQAVLAGYIDGSQIRGGTIQIGEYYDDNGDRKYAFEVDSEGTVTMSGSSTLGGYAKEDEVNRLIEGIDTAIISDTEPVASIEGRMWINTSTDPYELKIYTNGQWQYFSQQSGNVTFTKQPESYNKGDIWIVEDGSKYNSCKIVDKSPVDCLMEVWNGTAETTKYYTKDGTEIHKEDCRSVLCGTPSFAEGDDPAGFVIDVNLDTTSSSIDYPFVVYDDGSMYHELEISLPITSINILNKNGESLCYQEDVKYYGVDANVNVEPNVSYDLCLICSGGNIYLVDDTVSNKFFCEQSGTPFVNGKILKAIESSSYFSYDHWVDALPDDTEMQNNIYNTFTFDKQTGMTIGQTDNKFYVNIDSEEMGFYDNSEGQRKKVVHISNHTANIDNVIIEGSAEFDCNATFNEQVNFFGFVFKKESNGSLSLAFDG